MVSPRPQVHQRPVGQHPEIDRLVLRARRQLAAGNVLICAHQDTRAMVVCAQHPSAGLLCPTCLATHAARHDHEHDCDRCGADDVDGIVAIMTTVLAVVDTISPTAGPSRFAGNVIIGCLGLCPPCAGPPTS